MVDWPTPDFWVDLEDHQLPTTGKESSFHFGIIFAACSLILENAPLSPATSTRLRPPIIDFAIANPLDTVRSSILIKMGESRFVLSSPASPAHDATLEPRRRKLTGSSRSQELVQWLNSLLQLNITKVEQCGTG